MTAAQQEAKSFFGDDTVYIEKFLINPHHVEIQIMADKQGNYIYLGERDCSMQRRNQKVLEECPSPVVDEELRQKMGNAAVTAAKQCGYYNAGTIEFLVDDNHDFYFMEMNTRLQVEHGVTEMVTGLDIVQWQIRIAAGARLTRTQDSIFTHGNVIECRINAENPDKNFRPSCGRIKRLHTPGGSFVRFDTAVYQDYVVPPYDDSMIGKLIVQARSRAEAIRKMKMALSELTIDGIDINRDILAEILSDDRFVSGEYTTDFMENFEKIRNKR